MLEIERGKSLFTGMNVRSYFDPEVDPDALSQLVLTIEGFDGDSEEWDAAMYLGQVFASWLVKFADPVASERWEGELSAAAIFTKTSKLGAKADDVQDDIHYLGPKGYEHPKIEPFFITPTTKCIQRQARVAFDGTNYLVIWTENRYSTGECLFGCRVTPQGKILDPGGFPIHTKGEHLFPRLAAGKDKTGKRVYLVVWVDRSKPYAQVKGALIRSAGKVQIVVTLRTAYLNALLLDAKAISSAGIYIFPDIDGSCNPWKVYPELADYDYADVAFNGTDFVVTCIAGTQVVARLVDPNDGGVKVEQPVQKNVVYPWGKAITVMLWDAAKTSYGGGGLTRTRVASGGGDQCLITWHKLAAPGVSHLWGIKLNFYGTTWKVGPPKKISKQLEPPYGDCTMASNGSGSYMLAWHDLSNAGKKKKSPGHTAWPDLAQAAIKPVAGNPQDYGVHNFTFMMKANHSDYYPSSAFDGQNYLITLGGVTSDLVNFHPKLCCLVGIVIAGYVSPDAKLLDAFYIKPEYGGSAQSADVCFGKNEGLMVYEHIDADKWNTTSSKRKLRLRFIGKSK